MTDFNYHFETAPEGGADTLLLLHGTGGDERQLVPLGRQLFPDAALLSPRGRVLENGAPRFFRRFAEGVLDLEDWKKRSHELADFVQGQCEKQSLDPGRLTAFGYSNGANIALGLLLWRPEVLSAAVLMRPMFVSDDVPGHSLAGKRVLILSGAHDPLIPREDHSRLTRQLEDAGAEVTARMLEAGHAPVSEDFEEIRRWSFRT